jgi:cytosine/adenosine deaminase-related metal-dependent hydrolase
MLLQAPYLLPITSPPIANGAILIRAGLIADIGLQTELRRRYLTEEVIDFSSAAILPGLVNPHVHLELSRLAGAIPRGLPFADWIVEVIKLRSGWDTQTEKESINLGIKQCLAHGITCVGDISRSGLSAGLLAEAGLSGVVFLEVLGFREESIFQALSRLEETLADFPQIPDLFPGISPHAPYSTALSLYQKIAAMAGNYPICTHLAETRAEVEFLHNGGGPLRELLQDMGAWEPGWQAPGLSPVKYLERLGALFPGLLAVHINCLTAEDINVLARVKPEAIVCPGSNHWFGRENLHLPEIVASGINLALATDSLASNEMLNMFYEMSLCKQAYPRLDPEFILKMSTINGARALNLEHRLGSLQTGKRADLALVDIPQGITVDKLIGYLVSAEPAVSRVVLNGNLIPSS